ncbi:MAG: DUF799 family lipoprotein [Nitrospinae bacterium]|nr:DUF799 family lipoprotein [Nitrospinota bacterium]
MKNFLSIGVLLLTFAACAATTLPEIKPNSSNPIRTVAVLPFINSTNDVDGPEFVRDWFVQQLRKFYYEIQDVDDTNQILKDQMGITLGSQLDMVDPKKIGEVLGVDGVFYGLLDDFSERITGVYNAKRVRIRSKLVDCKTGQTVWKNGIGIKQGSRSTGSSFGEQVPILNDIFAVGGIVSSLGSNISDEGDKDLPKFLGEDVSAPWIDLPTGGRTVEANVVLGVAERVYDKALNSPLKVQAVTAISVLLKGYYYKREPWGESSYTPYGTMLITGPGK